MVTVVGSGTLVPSPRRSTPALALQTPQVQLTVDGGSGTLRRQAELGLDFGSTDALLFTHIHPDHTLDLLHFLFSAAYAPGYDRLDPVTLVGPPGFTAFTDNLRQGVRNWTRGGAGGFQVQELADRESVQIGDVSVEAVALKHSVVDHGYRFTGPQGRVWAFTGDTGPCPELGALAGETDLWICECSGDSQHPLDGHMTAAEVGKAARAAGVGQLVLSHLYPLPNDRSRIPEAAAEFSGPILLASDGDQFIV